MIYILYGQDSYTCREELTNLKKTLGDPEILSVNTSVLKGSDTTSSQLIDMCQVVPFMNSYRLIIVEGLLDLFEPEYKQKESSKLSRTRKNKHIDEWNVFAGSMGSMPESSVVVFIDERASKNNPLLKLFGPHATIKTFPPLREAALYTWVKDKASKIGVSINVKAIKLLVEYCGNDLWVLNNEIEKLAAYCSGREIDEEDVMNLTCYSKDANIFYLVDAIFDKKLGHAQNILQRLMEEGTNTSYIITMIARQLRLIIKAKYLESKTSRGKALEELSLSSEYLLNKTINQAKKYSVDQLKDCYHRLLQTDIDIKSGKYNEDVAVDLLVADLCR